MKTFLTASIAAAICTLAVAPSSQAQGNIKPAKPLRNDYISLKLEMERAITRGNQFLKSQRNADGYWSDGDMPAMTALAMTSILRDPALDGKSEINELDRKSLDWIVAQQKEDGGIYNKGLGNYNTATSIVALVAAQDKAYHPAILKARAYVIGAQDETDDEYNGGVGYGGTYNHSDLSNTYLAIEALKVSEQIAKDSEAAGNDQPDLNWDAAIQFISRCQNNKETNDMPNAGNDGGMIYFPGNTKSDEEKNADGTVSLRSYGSISYAGLLSLLYADLDKSDVRVKAVLNWAGNNFTVEENPGLGPQGLYYYYHAMSKALSAAGIENLPLKGGKEADWRRDLAIKILTTQREDGSWVNTNSRWWESDPQLVTSYATMTLQQIYYAMP
ncbi:prenyltransferase/squalene oxidase repeat-containing protein [Persicirhabdus sediminis]|uniref:Terpene cyclase/mutase family protein n=1 Tax=Persicirhabdus sediminis TaxID=454144 RepID=A0A8J7ME14_9BACT|nr:prenyltransferase/squalene oxidase repeat-containing protein [Persicirhabdus sediminis]MBK1790955.1 terpene cyclase/mutase family protein [Persicirhabdus sediminis]